MHYGEAIDIANFRFNKWQEGIIVQMNKMEPERTQWKNIEGIATTIIQEIVMDGERMLYNTHRKGRQCIGNLVEWSKSKC